MNIYFRYWNDAIYCLIWYTNSFADLYLLYMVAEMLFILDTSLNSLENDDSKCVETYCFVQQNSCLIALKKGILNFQNFDRQLSSKSFKQLWKYQHNYLWYPRNTRWLPKFQNRFNVVVVRSLPKVANRFNLGSEELFLLRQCQRGQDAPPPPE